MTKGPYTLIADAKLVGYFYTLQSAIQAAPAGQHYKVYFEPDGIIPQLVEEST